jgi:glycolate oxidase iron-sulfur subunit
MESEETQIKPIKKKDKSKERIRIENLKEEIQEELSKCINCGLCNSSCLVFRLLKNENYSPRGRVNLLKEGIIDKEVFKCNLCKSCEKNCPLDIKICDTIIKAREIVLIRKKLKNN